MSAETPRDEAPSAIRTPPHGWAILLALGPSIVWCAEYIGSGEVIIATRTGAVLGTGVIWAVVVGIFLKYLIGLAGGWYTVATGESMIDLFGRLPGPNNVFVWFVAVVQLVASILAIGALASSAGVFLAEFLTNIGLPTVDAYWMGWAVTIAGVLVAWVGEFQLLKTAMAALVTVTLAGIVVVAWRVFPPFGDIMAGLVPHVPPVPEWAIAQKVSENAWAEVLPLLGWGAGGFASQVWYTYWIMGAGYGAAAGGKIGKPADTERLAKLTTEEVEQLRGWRSVITFDATTALVVGTAATLGFLFAGAGVLRANELAPKGTGVALTLANLFGQDWGATGATLFLAGGATALISTQFAQVAGWSCMLDDLTRICLPKFAAGVAPIKRRRAWLVFYLMTSMTIVYSLGYQPVALVRVSAVLEGLVLTPLQALALLAGLYWVLPKMLGPEAAERLRPGPWIGVGLLVSFLVFSYFCVVQLPKVLME